VLWRTVQCKYWMSFWGREDDMKGSRHEVCRRDLKTSQEFKGFREFGLGGRNAMLSLGTPLAVVART
jgi:hypothetical protein